LVPAVAVADEGTDTVTDLEPWPAMNTAVAGYKETPPDENVKVTEFVGKKSRLKVMTLKAEPPTDNDSKLRVTVAIRQQGVLTDMGA